MKGMVYMKAKVIFKPNMTNLKGKTGRKVLEQLRTNIVISDENIQKEASECKQRLLAMK